MTVKLNWTRKDRPGSIRLDGFESREEACAALLEAVAELLFQSAEGKQQRRASRPPVRKKIRPTDPNEKLLTARELAEALGVPTHVVYSYVRASRKNKVPHTIEGRTYRFRLSEVRQWLEAQKPKRA